MPSFFGHNKISTPVEIAVERQSLGLDTEKPLYLWRFTLLDLNQRLKAGQGIPEWMNDEILAKTGFFCDYAAAGGFVQKYPSGKELKDSFALKPEFLEYFVLSNGPAAIWSLDGKRTNFWQGASGNMQLESTEAENRIIVRQTVAGKVESIVVLPNDWSRIAAENGALKAAFFLNGQQYAIIALEHGKDAVLPEIFAAAEEKCRVRFRTFSTKSINIPDAEGGVFEVVPMQILTSAQTGRRYLAGYIPEKKRFHAFRLDYIRNVKRGEPEPDYDALAADYRRNLAHLFGVSFGIRRDTGAVQPVRLTVRLNEETEDFILERLEREKRIGTLERPERDCIR